MSADLPNDPARLREMFVAADKDRADLLEQNRILTLQLRKMEAKVQALMQQYFGRSSEKMDPKQLHLALEAAQADYALAEEESPVPRKMEAKVQALMQQYFGRSSEKMDPKQLHLALEAAQADYALAEEESPVPPKPRAPSDRRSRRMEDLPVLERVYLDVSPEEKIAPDGTPMVKIREEVTDLVDYRPGCLFRRQIVRPVYASPSHATAPRIA